MADFDLRLTRRSAFVAMACVVQARVAFAAEEPSITVHKDPSCGCCSGWVQHLQKAGFVTKVFDTNDIDAVKKRLAVPGMPIGSPGMEGGKPEKYDVVLFGPDGRRTYVSFIGERSV